MKRKLLFFTSLSIIYVTSISCSPSACECLEIVDNKLPYFGNNGENHAKKSAECYALFSDEPYQKYTATEDWKKQADHAQRLQPIARMKMIKECEKQ